MNSSAARQRNRFWTPIKAGKWLLDSMSSDMAGTLGSGTKTILTSSLEMVRIYEIHLRSGVSFNSSKNPRQITPLGVPPLLWIEVNFCLLKMKCYKVCLNWNEFTFATLSRLDNTCVKHENLSYLLMLISHHIKIIGISII